MDSTFLKKALSTEISAAANNEDDTKLASVLVIIYDHEPKVIMTEKMEVL